MQRYRVMSRLKHAVCVVALSAVSLTAVAAPYSISYTGTISDDSFAQIINGQPYTVTVVFDNGGSDLYGSQTWTQANLTCVIFQMNTAGNVAFAQNLAATSAELTAVGSVTTAAGGALTANFTNLGDEGTGPAGGTYSYSGFTPQLN